VPDIGVPVVDDAAQAHGALGPGGDAGTGAVTAATIYSFYPTKNLGGVGDGGSVVTDDDELAARVRQLRVHGMTEQYVHTEISQNFRMSELEAAWLRLALPDLAAGNARRRAIAARYAQAAPLLRWHPDHPRHVRHLCVVRVRDRERFRTELGRAGIGTAVHYPLALTQQPAYRRFTRHPCPNAEAWAAECVSLPCFPELTDDEVDAVCKVLADVEATPWAR
jgi:dTDP-4-amino-4,6-dideoxygalactose transaminase